MNAQNLCQNGKHVKKRRFRRAIECLDNYTGEKESDLFPKWLTYIRLSYKWLSYKRLSYKSLSYKWLSELLNTLITNFNNDWGPLSQKIGHFLFLFSVFQREIFGRK